MRCAEPQDILPVGIVFAPVSNGCVPGFDTTSFVRCPRCLLGPGDRLSIVAPFSFEPAPEECQGHQFMRAVAIWIIDPFTCFDRFPYKRECRVPQKLLHDLSECFGHRKLQGLCDLVRRRSKIGKETVMWKTFLLPSWCVDGEEKERGEPSVTHFLERMSQVANTPAK